MGESSDAMVDPAALTAPEPRPPRGTIATGASGALVLGALGVVFGDIGTSPLYAVQAVLPLAAMRCAPPQSTCTA